MTQKWGETKENGSSTQRKEKYVKKQGKRTKLN